MNLLSSNPLIAILPLKHEIWFLWNLSIWALINAFQLTWTKLKQIGLSFLLCIIVSFQMDSEVRFPLCTVRIFILVPIKFGSPTFVAIHVFMDEVCDEPIKKNNDNNVAVHNT